MGEGESDSSNGAKSRNPEWLCSHIRIKTACPDNRSFGNGGVVWFFLDGIQGIGRSQGSRRNSYSQQVLNLATGRCQLGRTRAWKKMRNCRMKSTDRTVSDRNRIPVYVAALLLMVPHYASGPAFSDVPDAYGRFDAVSAGRRASNLRTRVRQSRRETVWQCNHRSVNIVRIYVRMKLVRMKLHGYRTLMRLEWRFARIHFGGDWNWRPEGNGKSNFVPEYFQIPATQNRHSPSFDSRSCLLRNRTVRGQAVTDAHST